MLAAEMQKASLAQSQRGVREVVRTVQDPKGEVLQASPCRTGRRRRLPQVRVPQAGGGRLPFVRGAARTGTSSARRSAGTPSTRRRSTSSRRNLTGRTGRATSTSVCRPGTPARSRNRRQPTGRRCQTPNRAKSASGRALCSRVAGATAAARAAFPVEAHYLRVVRLGLARRAVEPRTARRGLSGATGTVGAADP